LIERIERQTGALTREVFLQDADVQDATAYRLLAIGEAAKDLDDELKSRHPHIPWRQVLGMRNILARSTGESARGITKPNARLRRTMPAASKCPITTSPRGIAVEVRDGFYPEQRFALAAGVQLGDLCRDPAAHRRRARVGHHEAQFAQALPAPPRAQSFLSF